MLILIKIKYFRQKFIINITNGGMHLNLFVNLKKQLKLLNKLFLKDNNNSKKRLMKYL